MTYPFCKADKRVTNRTFKNTTQILREMSAVWSEMTDIEQALHFIDLHFSEELSNKRIAEVFSFHPNHISAKIKQTTGMSLHKYLIHTRLMHAIDMLEAGEKNISAISEACGFFDAAHFSRTFKSAFGCNPKKYGAR